MICYSETHTRAASLRKNTEREREPALASDNRSIDRALFFPSIHPSIHPLWLSPCAHYHPLKTFAMIPIAAVRSILVFFFFFLLLLFLSSPPPPSSVLLLLLSLFRLLFACSSFFSSSSSSVAFPSHAAAMASQMRSWNRPM